MKKIISLTLLIALTLSIFAGCVTPKKIENPRNFTDFEFTDETEADLFEFPSGAEEAKDFELPRETEEAEVTSDPDEIPSDFVPDSPPEEWNKTGNPMGNLVSLGSGYVTKQGDWIYYINKNVDSFVYKVKTDGSQKTKISELKPEQISVVGNWVYMMQNYGEVYKVLTDGRNERKLHLNRGAFARLFYVIEDTIYGSGGKMDVNGKNFKLQDVQQFNSPLQFTDDAVYQIVPRGASGKFDMICKSDLNYKNFENIYLTEYNLISLTIAEDKLIFLVWDEIDELQHIMRTNLDGSDATFIFENYSQVEPYGKMAEILYHNGWVYNTVNVPLNPSENRLFRVNLDGSDWERVTLENPEEGMRNMQGIGDYIYFFDYTNTLKRVNVDGSGKEIIM